MDSGSFNIPQYQYDDWDYDKFLVSSNKELPPLMNGLDPESNDFSNFPNDCLIDMQSPVDQWSFNGAMPLHELYPLEESNMDFPLWVDDNFFSDNSSYSHMTSTDQSGTLKSVDQLLVSNANEKINGDMIMSSEKNDVEHDWQGMKLPTDTTKTNYGHMSAEQYSIPNPLDQLLVNNNSLIANEKEIEEMIMSSIEDDTDHGWQGKMPPTGGSNYGHMSADQFLDQLLVSNFSLNANEKEIEAMMMMINKKKNEDGWQGMKMPTETNYGQLSVDLCSIPNQFFASYSGLNANEKINGNKDGHGWQGMKLPGNYDHMSADQYSIAMPNTINQFLVTKSDLNGNGKENGAMINSSEKEDKRGWQGMKVTAETRNSSVHRSQVNGERKQRSRSIGFQEISRYFYVPIMQAAKMMRVGLTVLKKRCRELGINRWPHRKMKSLDSLILNVQEMKIKIDGEGSERVEVERLIEHKRMMEKMPEMELTKETKKLRQACFKANFKKRRLMAMGPY